MVVGFVYQSEKFRLCQYKVFHFLSVLCYYTCFLKCAHIKLLANGNPKNGIFIYYFCKLLINNDMFNENNDKCPKTEIRECSILEHVFRI